MKFITYDVEANGPCPGIFSMTEFGAVDNDGNEYYSRIIKPISQKYVESAVSVTGVTVEMQEREGRDPIEVMLEFDRWLGNHKRIISWSDNPAFDWQFINYYFHAFTGRNPLGFSSRRIGDYYAGLNKRPSKTVQWKRFRKTKHTHNPVEDARGNMEALQKILAMR